MAFHVERNSGDWPPGIFAICPRPIYGHSGMLADLSGDYRRGNVRRRGRGKRVYPKLEVTKWQ